MISLWASACTLLVVCGGTGSARRKPLRVGNFNGLSAGTAAGPLDGIFTVREDYLQFQNVHELTFYTRTCSVCSGIQYVYVSTREVSEE